MNHYLIEIINTNNTSLYINNKFVRTDHYDRVITLVMMRIQPDDKVTINNSGNIFEVDYIYLINFWMELKQ